LRHFQGNQSSDHDRNVYLTHSLFNSVILQFFAVTSIRNSTLQFLCST
jgi:hypothetical protein